MKPAWIITSVVLHASGAFLVLGTLAPFLPVGAWIVRGFDFPRVHIAVSCVVVMLLLVALGLTRGWRVDIPVALGLLLACASWQAWRIAPYTPLWARSVGSSPTGEFRLLVSNVEVDNTRRDEVAREIERADADVLLLIEIDEAWARSLAPVRDRYTHHLEDIRPDGLGIALWSRVAWERAEIREIVSEKRPSVHARLRLADGHVVRFVGVHPTPPGLRRDHDGDDDNGRYDSRIRDAELILVAKEIEEDASSAWIVAGDFNDVAWSHTTRLFQKISGTKDPRVGRGLFNTYHAEYTLLRYPVDHVFVSPGFRVADMRRVRTPGSDHFGILADLSLERQQKPEHRADADDREEAEEIVEEGVEDAAQNGESPG